MENEKMLKGLRLMLVGGALIVMLSALVIAIGVGYDGSIVVLYPGETRDSSFILQNYGPETNDIVVEATIEEGGEYFSFTSGSTFNVDANGNFAAPVRYFVPADANIGDVHNVQVFFRVISSEAAGDKEGEGNTIEFAINPRIKFDVEVVPERVEEQTGGERASANLAVWMWVVIVILIILILWWLIARRKRNNDSFARIEKSK